MPEDKALQTIEVTAITETRHAPDHKEVYSSSTRTRVSSWDVALIFGHHVEKEPGKPDIAIEEQVTVTMSPHHFKAFASVVASALVGYETAMGKISIPEAVMPKVATKE